MKRLEIWLPKLLPTPALSPNGNQKRVPRMVNDQKQVMLDAVYYGVLADETAKAAIGSFNLVHLFMELRWCSRRRDGSVYLPDDAQNLGYALKAAADGLVKVGLIKDDSYKYVDIFSSRVCRVATREEEGLWIVITELEEEPTRDQS